MKSNNFLFSLYLQKCSVEFRLKYGAYNFAESVKESTKIRTIRLSLHIKREIITVWDEFAHINVNVNFRG